jgi:hypothetical protein
MVTMKRKYSQAAHAKRNLKDAYINGMTEDEQAEEMLDWYDDHQKPYEASTNHCRDDETIPF